MRAEVTVGLDLKSLENLRIYNGYETEKNRKLSLEASSADDNESDTGLGEWTSSKEKSSKKCGRPANPIPRHKRDSHIKAEYKRRDKIQKGFDTLLAIVPELAHVSEKESKAKMLFKSADYCRQLKSECGSTQRELTALRYQLDSIGTEIQELQDQLPNNGVDTVKRCDDVAMDTLYDQYVKDETKKNWKFWIFRFFIHPLYKSFKEVTSGQQNSDEFNKSVFQWLQSCLSLGNLRKGFLESLRTISKRTSIMTNPEQLQQEATSNTHHCFIASRPESITANVSQTIKERGQVEAPTMTERGPAAVSSTKGSPVHISTPSPPRTPNVLKRLSRREIPRKSSSRSRSNSPTQIETESKRRSNYRSRSGRRIGNDQEKTVEYATSVGNPSLPLLSQLLTSPHFVKTTQYRPATVENTNLNTNYDVMSKVPPKSRNTINTAQNKLSFNMNFAESPRISVCTSVDMIGTNVNMVDTNVPIIGTSVDMIGTNVNMIDSNVPMIGTSVDMIGTNVSMINSNVPMIGTSVDMIGTNVNMIDSNVPMIGTSVDMIGTNVSMINSNVPMIGTNLDVIMPTPATQIQFTTPGVCSVTPSITTSMFTEPISAAYISHNISKKPDPLNMYYLSTTSSGSYLPSSSSSIISGTASSSQRGCHVDLYQTTESCKVQTVDVLLSTSDSDNILTDLPNLTSAMSDQASGHIYSENFGDSQKLDPLSPDEDSLLDLLSFDVMDVGTVMKFLSDDKQTQS